MSASPSKRKVNVKDVDVGREGKKGCPKRKKTIAAPSGSIKKGKCIELNDHQELKRLLQGLKSCQKDVELTINYNGPEPLDEVLGRVLERSDDAIANIRLNKEAGSGMKGTNVTGNTPGTSDKGLGSSKFKFQNGRSHGSSNLEASESQDDEIHRMYKELLKKLKGVEGYKEESWSEEVDFNGNECFYASHEEMTEVEKERLFREFLESPTNSGMNSPTHHEEIVNPQPSPPSENMNNVDVDAIQDADNTTASLSNKMDDSEQYPDTDGNFNYSEYEYMVPFNGTMATTTTSSSNYAYDNYNDIDINKLPDEMITSSFVLDYVLRDIPINVPNPTSSPPARSKTSEQSSEGDGLVGGANKDSSQVSKESSSQNADNKTSHSNYSQTGSKSNVGEIQVDQKKERNGILEIVSSTEIDANDIEDVNIPKMSAASLSSTENNRGPSNLNPDECEPDSESIADNVIYERDSLISKSSGDSVQGPKDGTIGTVTNSAAIRPSQPLPTASLIKPVKVLIPRLNNTEVEKYCGKKKEVEHVEPQLEKEAVSSQPSSTVASQPPDPSPKLFKIKTDEKARQLFKEKYHAWKEKRDKNKSPISAPVGAAMKNKESESSSSDVAVGDKEDGKMKPVDDDSASAGIVPEKSVAATAQCSSSETKQKSVSAKNAPGTEEDEAMYSTDESEDCMIPIVVTRKRPNRIPKTNLDSTSNLDESTEKVSTIRTRRSIKQGGTMEKNQESIKVKHTIDNEGERTSNLTSKEIAPEQVPETRSRRQKKVEVKVEPIFESPDEFEDVEGTIESMSNQDEVEDVEMKVNVPETASKYPLRNKRQRGNVESVAKTQLSLAKNSRVKVDYIKLMTAEVKKANPDLTLLSEAMAETFKARKKMVDDPDKDVETIVEKFPALKNYKMVKEEYGLVHNTHDKMANLEEALEGLLKEAINLKQDKGRQHPLITEAKKKWKENSASCDPKLRQVLGMIALSFRFGGSHVKTSLCRFLKNNEVLSQAEINKLVTPTLVFKESDVFSIEAEFWIYVETRKYLKVPNFYEGVLSIYAIYYAFNLCYDPKLTPVFEFFDMMAGNPQSTFRQSKTLLGLP